MLVRYSQSFRSYPMSVMSLAKSFSEQLTKRGIYLVVEVDIDIRMRKVCYTLIDDAGCPAVYEACAFDIISSNLDGYRLLMEDDGDILLTPAPIFEAGRHDFWDAYFDAPMNRERTLLENVLRDLSSREGIPAPILEHRGYV